MNGEMDSALVASSTTAFITAIQGQISDNLVLVLTFAAGIMVWVVLKKWVFGGTHRI